jgi:hypothetical protein
MEEVSASRAPERQPLSLCGLGPRVSGISAAAIREVGNVPEKRANVTNEKQYEALKEKGMSKERAAKIANSPGGGKAAAQKHS